MKSLFNKLKRENLRADIQSTRILLENKKYKGYCESLSPVSPIFKSKSLIFHYKFVFSFSKYRIATVQYLAARSMEKASCGAEIHDGFKKNPSLKLELLHSHYQLKKRILDGLVDNISDIPADQHTIEWQIHKTLFNEYIIPFSWILAFMGFL